MLVFILVPVGVCILEAPVVLWVLFAERELKTANNKKNIVVEHKRVCVHTSWESVSLLPLLISLFLFFNNVMFFSLRRVVISIKMA